jgi:hypothetical protein
MWNRLFPPLLQIDKIFSLLNLDFDEEGGTLAASLIPLPIFPVVNQWLPAGFGGAASDQENSCVRHKLSPCAEMLM